MSFVEYKEERMVARWGGGAPRRQMVDLLRIDQTQTFFAVLDEVSEVEIGRTRYYYGSFSRRRMLHKFVAPFEPRNTKLILDTSIPLLMRGDDVTILLDKAMEAGLAYERDFAVLKGSKYVKICSEDLRLFLTDQLTVCPPFDLMFEVALNLNAPFEFDLTA